MSDRPCRPRDRTERDLRPERATTAEPADDRVAPRGPAQPLTPEIGGPQGPEPTRYGDWEKGGRCSDF